MALTEFVIMPGQDWQSICDHIREITGGTDLLTSGDVVEITNTVLQMDEELLNAGGAYPASSPFVKTVVIPENTAYLDMETFQTLPNVTEVHLNGNCEVEVYQEYNSTSKTYTYQNAFTAGNIQLEHLTVKNRNELPQNFLKNTTTLKSVKIENCAGLGVSVFEGCSALTDVVFSGYAGAIPSNAFQLCTSLKNVTLCEGVTELAYYCFGTCMALESLTIPRTVTYIDSAAFYGHPSYGVPDVLLRVYSGSYAETWAIENGNRYEVIEE